MQEPFMNTETTKKTIAIVAEFKEMNQEDLSPETTIEELGMDSLDALNLVFELEEAFDIMIPDEEAFEMKTIGEMIAGIDLLIKQKEEEEERKVEEKAKG